MRTQPFEFVATHYANTLKRLSCIRENSRILEMSINSAMAFVKLTYPLNENLSESLEKIIQEAGFETESSLLSINVKSDVEKYINQNNFLYKHTIYILY